MIACTLLAIALVAQPAATARRTDFSGTWQLDLARSDFGGGGGPDRRTDTITQTASTLTVKRAITLPDGERSLVTEIDLNGRETVQKVPTGDLKVKARWDGATLVVVGHGSAPGGGDTTITDVWQLSADRRTLTMRRKIESPDAAFDQVLVFTRA
jgi:hypothetical protein